MGSGGGDRHRESAAQATAVLDTPLGPMEARGVQGTLFRLP